MSGIIVTGWREGFRKISMTKLILAYTGFSLAQGKRCTDDIVEGKTVVFEIDGETAERFACEARELGAICHVGATLAVTG